MESAGKKVDLKIYPDAGHGLENPNKIEVGQVLRVLPPVVAEGVATTKPVTSAAVTATPIAAGTAAKGVPARKDSTRDNNRPGP